MCDRFCIVVECGRELRIGPDASCDVVLSLPQPPVAGFSRLVCRDPVFACVSCSVEGVLRLQVVPCSLPVYVNNIEMPRHQRPMQLYPGAFVSFLKLCRQLTCRFFTTATRPVEQPAPESNAIPPKPAAAVGRRGTPPIFLAPRGLRGKFGKMKFPRSPRVVHIATPSSEGNAQSVLTSCGSQLSKETEKNPCRSPTGAEDSAFTHAALSYLSEADPPLPPPAHAIVPYVVEVWGEHASLHTVMGQSSIAMSDPDQPSDLSLTGATVTYKPPADPYVTSNARDMLKCVRYMRFATSVRTAATAVLECIEGAYDPQKCTFIPFPQHKKK
ncbi:protein phosphatase [Trypanosoma conorhini]|uniref:Protein phosphatase n=1 Tax=Trypanosoma conorhini TaxID=83891 RepID=A0A3R7MRY3_9TRYP|nr:protein phosphatase [Trypanosoma conorhini]RNF19691.1 protein phosphatase [Trypanosoma conorhini]